jgi:hypothetical protein
MTTILWVALILAVWVPVGALVALWVGRLFRDNGAIAPAARADDDGVVRQPDLDRLNAALEVIHRPWVGR